MKRLGEILIEHGSITNDQLQAALDRQKHESGKLIGEILIQMGYVTEEDIVVALATQFNVPYLPVSNFSINETVLRIIPAELMKKYLCVPLDRIGNLLTVVIADPTNEKAVEELEAATQCKVQVFVATPAEITSVISQQFHIKMEKEGSPDKNVSNISFRSAVEHKKEKASD
ncbi:MAG: hypothetical protein A3G33_07305 [Omnitrophica bacterium RIFCSPLOWO2_12_FULL_44_17]|uniref:Type II secretion system protein GspE N-terminal domain-containing protein n=1 Tax=Candidatus Danuiimicrobium aquiferis TaxID=1801832 RepID=A0A1G1KYV7_9BACT|nr:MAG: hypothetical protein A3B72_07605 [Omnitrophica bacterium RIFCSPHIGHO2_02_FULL_45_28]OGW89234.1 MAG: hypothetical protein A3E74_08280 [Omnitrophica bacterium RIFCSPHIGHO2_12_FULL_44_12]OGW98033.1 MAG: hypothetical protein A3G33_07305 [Omnitrophica bacterium RIFCSPLOWO2_12_FULL_44_17]OGX03523.1 MAG: hypothetical protein A3J12_02925 [Omnitrophica bacterium RIFCSPLOWO2_02_FULL_44_11]